MTTVWTARYIWVTVGAVALIFLAATQALAITTVMPVVSADLGGEHLYAVAFSGTLATSVIGMVAVGAWCDRRDPVLPLTVSVVLFVIGLLIAGFAGSMEVLVVGRLLQGLGTGGQTVALYVVVARVYPAELHGRLFAAFSAAWVIPSLVGPVLAGAVAEHIDWRWVFLGVAILTAGAFALVFWKLHRTPLVVEKPSTDPVAVRLALATLVACAAVALSLAGGAGAWSPVIIVGALVIIAVAARPLLPRGTLRSARGLPSVVLMRALVAGALYGAEAYLPYVLIADYDFSPTFAGFGLTAAALAWAVAAEIQGRYGDRLGNRRITILGSIPLVIAIGGVGLAAWLHLPPAVIIAVWGLAGVGMGLMYPRLTVLTLAYSTPQNQGFNSAALSISDSVGASAAIAVMGVVFVSLAGTGAGFPVVFALATGLALLACVPGLRLGHARELSHASQH